MDCYRNMRDVNRAFVEFMDRVPFYGMVVLCNDDPTLRRLLRIVRRRTITYGTRRGSDFQIKLGVATFDEPNNQPISHFSVRYRDSDLGEFTLHVPGDHNVLNATAAIAVGVGLDIPTDKIREALDSFRGVDRRFQLKGKVDGVSVIDDYGHHPTEIRATLAAAKQCGFRKIHVIFQPHRFTRTRDLMAQFATAFNGADSVFVLDIYPASEQPLEGITAETVAARIRENGNAAQYAPSFADAVSSAVEIAKEGEVILTLGAGNVSQTGPMVLQKLASRTVLATPGA
jgi:UDP-N-acetylmuramate--alanine ligase